MYLNDIGAYLDPYSNGAARAAKKKSGSLLPEIYFALAFVFLCFQRLECCPFIHHRAEEPLIWGWGVYGGSIGL